MQFDSRTVGGSEVHLDISQPPNMSWKLGSEESKATRVIREAKENPSGGVRPLRGEGGYPPNPLAFF